MEVTIECLGYNSSKIYNCKIHMLRWIYGDTRSESSLSTKAKGITHVEQDE